MSKVKIIGVDHKWCASPQGCCAWSKGKNKCMAMGKDGICPNPNQERKLKDETNDKTSNVIFGQ